MELLSVTCPRCAAATSVEYYGPCDSCREELRETQLLVGVAAEPTDYEPKMNVTPNAVALRDD